MKVVVIIPTYNEQKNIASLVPELETIFSKIKNHDFEMLVVDDNSPDKTGEEVEKLAKEYKNIHLLKGEKKGLGVAYTRGIDKAIKDLSADVIFQMDADFSHDPKEIPNFMKQIEKGNDCVIGSRYVERASLPGEWGWYRKLNSFVASFIFGRIVAGLLKIHDVTSGYRAIRVKNILDKIDLSKNTAHGYSFQLTLLSAVVEAGAKVAEIPIKFAERKAGESKVGVNKTYFRDVLEFIVNATFIGIKRRQTFVKFLIVGTIGWLVNAFSLEMFIRFVFNFLAGFAFFFILDLGLFLSTIFSIELSIITLFIFHENWTFSDRPKIGAVPKRFLKFNLTSIGSPLIQLASVNILTPYFGIHRQIALAIGIIIGISWNWLWNSLWVWRKQK